MDHYLQPQTLGRSHSAINTYSQTRTAPSTAIINAQSRTPMDMGHHSHLDFGGRMNSMAMKNHYSRQIDFLDYGNDL